MCGRVGGRKPEGRGVHNGTGVRRIFLHAAVAQSRTLTGNTIGIPDLSHMLRERRREMQGGHPESHPRGRIDRPIEVRDDLEHSDADIQGDIEFALLRMRAKTLTRIDGARSARRGPMRVLFQMRERDT